MGPKMVHLAPILGSKNGHFRVFCSKSMVKPHRDARNVSKMTIFSDFFSKIQQKRWQNACLSGINWQNCQKPSKWRKSAKMAKMANFGHSGQFQPETGQEMTIFADFTPKSAKMALFGPQGDTSGPRPQKPCQKHRPGHQFLEGPHMGWTEIPTVFSTFLVPCIYGVLLRTENGPRNRAPWDPSEKGQKRARMTRSEGGNYGFLWQNRC